MRGHDDIVHLPEGVIAGEGFFREDVHAGTGDFFLREGVYEGGFIDDGGAGDVDEEGGFLHEGEFLLAEEVLGLGGRGEGGDDDVGLGEDFSELVFEVDVVSEHFCGEVFLYGEDACLEDFRSLGDGAADAAEAYDEDGLAEEGFPAGTDPFVGALVADGVGDAAHPCKEEGEGVLGDGAVVDAVGIREMNGAREHGGGKEALDAVGEGVYPADVWSGGEDGLCVLEAPHGDGVGVCDMGKGFFR